VSVDDSLRSIAVTLTMSVGNDMFVYICVSNAVWSTDIA